MTVLWVVLVLAVSACYSPSAPAGAPCMPRKTSCPTGQTCILYGGDYLCEPTGAPSGDDAAIVDDAAIDARQPHDARAIDGPPDDVDGDGIPNASDNCPTIANSDQANEDGDTFGDVCDPCPPVADDNPLDSDGDGVADACDPRPSIPGDKIALFEGFHAGVPVGWNKSGTWTAASDSISTDVHGSAGGKATLTLPTPGSAHETVSASVRLDALHANYDTSIGLVDDYDHQAHHGLYCHLTEWFPAPVTTPLVMGQLQYSGTPPNTSFEAMPGQTYTLRERRDDTTFTCDGERGTAHASIQETSSYAPTTPEVGLRVVDGQATYNWIMVVSN